MVLWVLRVRAARKGAAVLWVLRVPQAVPRVLPVLRVLRAPRAQQVRAGAPVIRGQEVPRVPQVP